MTRQSQDTSSEADARLSSLDPIAAVPLAVREDAQRQLGAILASLRDLADAFPVLDNPLVAWPPAAAAQPVQRPFGQEAMAVPAAPRGATTSAAASRAAGAGAAANATAENLLALPISQLAPLIERREVSPVEATRAALDHIQRHDGALHTFITVTADQALADARTAEQEIAAGRYRGPLHGVPVAAKDLYETSGIPTTCGSNILRDWTPDQDSHAVAAWRAGGAILLGKNTLHEFAFGGTSVNEHTGTPRNPWNPEHMCGGSSGGSATAVAAGFAYGSLGSETGNSVRRPASFCGVVGLKPTYGRISRRGVFPLAWSLDHVGVFARTAADAATLIAPLMGYDAADPGSRHAPAGAAAAAGTMGAGVAGVGDAGSGGSPAAALAPLEDLRGRRAGVPVALLTGIDPEVASAFHRALQGLRERGVEVVEIDLPLASRWTAISSSVTMHAEAAAIHARWVASRSGEYGADVLARLLAGAALTAADYARAQAIRGAITAELLDTLHPGVRVDRSGSSVVSGGSRNTAPQ